MIRCIAKGSKREKSAFSGGLEIATMGHMVAIVKPDSDLAILTAWDLIEPMYLIRQSLARFHACMYAIDLIPRLINDHDPHPAVYDALLSALSALSVPESCRTMHEIYAHLAWYQWQLLEHTGTRPELMVDVSNGERFEDDAQVFGFSAHLGGLTVDPVHLQSGQSDTRLSDTWRVRRSTVDLLRQLRTGIPPSELNEAPQEHVERLGGLLASYIRSIIGVHLPSSTWLYPQI